MVWVLKRTCHLPCFHCPLCFIFYFFKPKNASITRHVWYYERCNYDLMRLKLLRFHGRHLKTIADNLHNIVIAAARECIQKKKKKKKKKRKKKKNKKTKSKQNKNKKKQNNKTC